MTTNTSNTHQEERKEAITARLEYVLASHQNPDVSGVYTLASTGKTINFKKQKNPWKLSRLLWRIGELKIKKCHKNLVKIYDLLEIEMDYYSFVWALGRIGEVEDIALLEQILTEQRDMTTVQAVCTQSILLLDENHKLKIKLSKAVPIKITALVNGNQISDLGAMLERCSNDEKPNNWLYDFYLLHWDDINIKAIFLSALQSIPLKGNYFKSYRKIIKAAEHFEDVQTLALLYWKINKSHSGSSVILRGNWKRGKDGKWHHVNVKKYALGLVDGRYQYVPLEEELKKLNTSFGYTTNTKQYLQKRFVRTLFRSGAADQLSFTSLAASFLLQANDAEAKTPYTETRYKWFYDDTTRRWRSEKEYFHYPLHWDNTVLYRLLYTNSERYSIASTGNLVHAIDRKSTKEAGRLECFPHLWDNAPRDVIRLLAQSNTELVQRFAQKVFKDNKTFLDAVQVDDLVAMLARPYTETKQLAIQTIKEQFTRFESEDGVFLALLDSGIEEGVQLAVEWLNKNEVRLLKETHFITQMILHPSSLANDWIVKAIEKRDFTKERKVVLLDYLLRYIAATQAPESIQKIISFIEKHLSVEASQVSETQLQVLVKHPRVEVQVFATRLIKKHEVPVAEMPYNLLVYLMTSENDQVRAAGIELFGMLPDDKLYQEQAAVSSCCVSPIAEVRQAILPTVLRLSKVYPDFAERLTKILSDALLMRGKATDVHAFIAELLTSPEMRDAIIQLPRTKMWRLLASKKYPTQEVGFAILEATIDARNLDMEEIVKLGKHELKDIREWAQKSILDQKERAIYEADKTLRLLETDWQDSRQFMMDFAAREFKERDWTPELLVSLCDSVRDEVQAFGLEQIQRFTKEENAQQFLEQLSQHPAGRVQKLAANWLEKYAAQNLTMLKELKPFFLTLLSQINKGRIAKDYAYQFLEREALRSPEHASIVIPILERVVLTIAVGDRSNCISILNNIRRKYPHLEMLLNSTTVEVIEEQA